MKSLQLQIALLSLMDANDLIPQTTNRVEFKQVRSGHWRLYVALPNRVPMAQLEPLLEQARKHGVWPNCFPGGPEVTAITFVDPDEHKA